MKDDLDDYMLTQNNFNKHKYNEPTQDEYDTQKDILILKAIIFIVILIYLIFDLI